MKGGQGVGRTCPRQSLRCIAQTSITVHRLLDRDGTCPRKAGTTRTNRFDTKECLAAIFSAKHSTLVETSSTLPLDLADDTLTAATSLKFQASARFRNFDMPHCNKTKYPEPQSRGGRDTEHLYLSWSKTIQSRLAKAPDAPVFAGPLALTSWGEREGGRREGGNECRGDRG